jgi:tetratricopeptide (TPR) repeat protein
MKPWNFLLMFMALTTWACQSQEGPTVRVLSDLDSTLSPEIRALCKRIAEDPRNAELYYLRGNAFYYEEQFEEAQIDLEASLSLNPDQALVHFRLAETCLQRDSALAPQAEFHFSEALRLKSDYHEAKMEQARLWVARQDYEKALANLRSLKPLDDFRDRAYLLESLVYREQGDTTRSEAVLDALLRVNAQSYDATMQKALILLNRKDDKCLKWLDKAIALDELSDEALYHKGLWLQWQGRYADAMALYENANKINPGHLYARYNRAVIENMFENYAQSEEHCNQILDMSPDFALALALRAYSREKLGYKKAAKLDYQAALQIDPTLEMAREGLNQVN